MPAESTPTASVMRQEGEAGLQRAVAAHVLEVERAEEERREHAGHEQAAHDARADEAGHAQDAQRHDRVLDPRLEHERTRPSSAIDDARRSRACAPRAQP